MGSPGRSRLAHHSIARSEPTMPYTLAPLFCRPWTLLGITPQMIESHYENNYGGAFVRLNAVAEELAALDLQTAPAHVVSRLKQEEMAALNSTLLHELYFASLGGDGRAVPEMMASAIERDFGPSTAGGVSSSPWRTHWRSTPVGCC